MKKYFKYILTLILLNIGCSNPKQNSQDNIKEIEILVPQKTSNTLEINCIDTIKLKGLEIDHHRINSDRHQHWVLSKRIVFGEVNLNSIEYYFSAKLKTNCKKPINYFSLDSLSLELQDSIFQTIILPEIESSSTLNQLAKPNSRVIDLNFDGQMDFDLALNEISGAMNEIRRYFIYNPSERKFEEGIDIANLGIDTSQNLIYNSWNGGHAGKISTRIWSKIVNYKELKTVKKIKSDYNSDLQSYIVETTDLNVNGQYNIRFDTINHK